MVRRQVLGDLSFEEARQAGHIGLRHAILGYDPGRCLAFSTYAWPPLCGRSGGPSTCSGMSQALLLSSRSSTAEGPTWPRRPWMKPCIGRSRAWCKVLLCLDGLIHIAASRIRGTAVTTTCYEATSTPTPRVCAAQLKDRSGCDGHSAACAHVCRFAPPRDAQARCVWYAGSNQPKDNSNQPCCLSPNLFLLRP